MADKYFRLVCLVVNVCPEPCRELFLKLAKSDPTRPYIDLGAYLARRRHEINRLKAKKLIRQDQYELVFPHVGSPNLSDWDVTLLVTLIKNLFNCQPLEIFSLDEMRTVRNELQHLPNTSAITDAEYDTYWGRLESAAKLLARQVSGNAFEIIIKNKIANARDNNMPDLGNALRSFYEEKITLMGEDIKDMKEEMTENSLKIQTLENTIMDLQSKTDTVAESCKESAACLRSSAVKKTGPNGDKVKRLKTVDNILCRLLRQFQLTMKTELPDNFLPPAEIADIRTKLRDKHHVVLTGFQNSRYVATALFVVKSLNYNLTRCVEMNNASEWRHIDPEDADLVLIRDPFGAHVYDEDKALSMLDIFDSVLHAVTPTGDEKLLDVIIVTEFGCLREISQLKEHTLLEEVVKVFDTTSENQPADLTSDHDVKVNSNWNQANFARQMTDILLSQFSEDSKRVDKETLKAAKATLKKCKKLVISGPGESGKTALAVALAASYAHEEVLLLSSPDDIKTIDFKRTSFVIIDEFVGRYIFDDKKVSDWYTRFDQLHVALTAGKLNVVVTCESTKLQKCIDEVGPHPLLSNQLSLSRSPVKIKQETLRSAALPSGSLTEYSPSQPGTSFDARREYVRSVESVRQYSVKIFIDKSCFITGCCTLPGGEILLADCWNKRLKKLDGAYNVISVCDIPGGPLGVCYIGNNVAVVSMLGMLVYVDVSSMTVRNTVTTGHSCSSITCYNHKLCVISDNTVYTYTLDGNNRSTLYKFKNISSIMSLHASFPFNNTKIAVSGDGNRIHVIEGHNCLITIDSCGNLLNSLSFPSYVARGVCVDDRNNVWVTVMLMRGVSSTTLYQVSADGARLLGTISLDKQDHGSIRVVSLCYDSERSSLILCWENDFISSVRLN